jgi:hypothetical protein
MFITALGLEEIVKSVLVANSRDKDSVQILRITDPTIIIDPNQDPSERHAYLVINGEVREFIPGYESRASENRIFQRGSIVFPQALHRQFVQADYPVAYEAAAGTDLVILTIELASIIGISCETIAALAEAEHRTVNILAETRKRLMLQMRLAEITDNQIARIHGDYCRTQAELNRVRIQLDEVHAYIREKENLLKTLRETQSALSEANAQLKKTRIELTQARVQIDDLNELVNWNPSDPDEHVVVCVEEQQTTRTQVGLSPPTQEDEPSRVNDDIELTETTDLTLSEDDSEETIATIPPPPRIPIDSPPKETSNRRNTVPFGAVRVDRIADPTNHDVLQSLPTSGGTWSTNAPRILSSLCRLPPKHLQPAYTAQVCKDML